jgi:hypothetical protein
VVQRRLPVHLAVIGRSKRSSKLVDDMALASRVLGILVDRIGFIKVTPAASRVWYLGSKFDQDLAHHVAGATLRKPRGMLDEDEVLRGRLTRSQTLIMSESMPSTRSIPAIRSLGVGGWVFVNRFVPIEDQERPSGRWMTAPQ